MNFNTDNKEQLEKLKASREALKARLENTAPAQVTLIEQEGKRCIHLFLIETGEQLILPFSPITKAGGDF